MRRGPLPAWAALAVKIVAGLAVVIAGLVVAWLVLFHRGDRNAERAITNTERIDRLAPRVETNSAKINGTLRCLSRARDPQSCLERVEGPRGPGGSSGTMGRRGGRGARGLAGAVGRTGSRGTRGSRGPRGRSGADGRDGADGADGRDGIDGEDGTPGRDGADGAPGKPPASWTFTDSTGLTQTCSMPDADLHYTCVASGTTTAPAP